jgi:diguanylate cyclase (GGDEF)-like protein
VNASTTVLIADDSQVVRAVVRSGLEEEGYHVIEADNGISALEQCDLDPPDVVLLDVEMPGLTGLQVLARLKADPTLQDIPVVFLTGRTTMSDVLTGLRGGAHDYLKKPFEPAELVARVGSAAQIKRLQDRLQERNAELELLSHTDTLTGLHNRRHLDHELNRYHQIARRHGDPVGLILLDIDHFKGVNDTYGHPTGDQVLCEFANRLRSRLRAGDIAGRWGGEEFLVILPGTDAENTERVAERIREAISSAPIATGGQLVPVTVSGGCVVDPGATPAQLLSIADARLYEAKKAGRDRIATGADSGGKILSRQLPRVIDSSHTGHGDTV